MKRIIPIGLLFILLLCHIPFLTADPDTMTDVGTRGAWTDEGLYSSQVRNLVTSGTFNIKENSTFVRGPLFNIIQYPFFIFFGPSLSVSRLIVLLASFSILLLFCFLPGLEIFTFFLILLNSGQFHIFQFSHYAMAEMICIDFILLALYFLIRFHRETVLANKKMRYLFLATFFIFCSYATKIQYLYTIPLVTLALVFQLAPLQIKKSTLSRYRYAGWSILFSLGLLLVYFVWFLANKDFYSYVMQSESAGRYHSNTGMIVNMVSFNFNHFLWTPDLKILLSLFMAGFLVTGLTRKMRKQDPENALIFGFALFWVILELHKLPMTYLPNRYLLSLIFAIGLVLALFLSSLSTINRYVAGAALSVAILVFVFNMALNFNAFKRRTFDLQRVTNYLGRYDMKDRYALGSWAAATNWKSGAHAVPVWKGYFNAEDPLTKFHPRVVLAESDESESEKAYDAQGIDLKSTADSSRSFKIWRYEVIVYWMKP